MLLKKAEEWRLGARVGFTGLVHDDMCQLKWFAESLLAADRIPQTALQSKHVRLME